MSEVVGEGEGRSCVGLREFLFVLELVGGGGGAGLGFCNFPLSLTDEESIECLCLRFLHSSPAAPIAGNTLGLRSSACRALVLGLRSVSLPKNAEDTSDEMFKFGGGVKVPIRGVFSPFCSLVLLRGRAGLPPKVPESKWR